MRFQLVVLKKLVVLKGREIVSRDWARQEPLKSKKAKSPPTKLQLEVLQWIADGCPVGSMTDPKYKVSAYALDRRNLVRVKRRRNPWIAEVTEEGIRLLAGGGPSGIIPAGHRAVPLPALQASPESPGAIATATSPAPEQARASTAPPKSATQKMMVRLSVEQVIQFDSAEAGRYKQLVAVARRNKLVPEDMELEVTVNWHKPCTVELRRRPEWQLVALEPVSVPAVIRKPHPIVAKLKHRTDRFGMDTARWNWTLRVVQGLIEEAERRGYGIAPPPARVLDHYGREQDEIHHLIVSIGEDAVQLHFSQAIELVPHRLTAAELRRKENGYPIPTEKPIKTNFINIRLTGLEPAFWQSKWTETDATPADTFLPRIIQEIELRAARAVERRNVRQRRDDEKRRQWERVRDIAIERLNEDHRAKVLLDQAERFQRVRLLDDYITAVKSQIASMNPADAAAATDWMLWAESHTAAINPLLGDIRMPAEPKPDPDALKPYMKGLSPHGPDLGIRG